MSVPLPILLGGMPPIRRIFAGGARGFALCPWLLHTLFQDRTGAAATTPVAVGDPVGTIADVSGNGWYATATSDAKRGVLRLSGGYYSIEFDGVDDSYRITSLTLGTSQYEWAALNQTSGQAFFAEHSANANLNNGHFFFGSSNSPWLTRRAASTHTATGVTNWADGLHVNERVYDLVAGGSYLRDGAVQVNNSVTGTLRTNSDVTDQYNIGSRNQASSFYGGHYYGHILRDGAQPTTAQILAVRQLLASKSGATI